MTCILNTDCFFYVIWVYIYTFRNTLTYTIYYIQCMCVCVFLNVYIFCNVLLSDFFLKKCYSANVFHVGLLISNNLDCSHCTDIFTALWYIFVVYDTYMT